MCKPSYSEFIKYLIIILVDLKQPLEYYIKFIPKVKILRTTRREGLVRARLLGTKHATAPVLVFLDSHCECTKGEGIILKTTIIIILKHIFIFKP